MNSFGDALGGHGKAKLEENLEAVVGEGSMTGTETVFIG